MRFRIAPPYLGLGLAWLLAGCQPEIGDPCTVPSDCSLNGTRLCDTTLPAGYCTVFNCEPGSCPDDSVCVSYQSVVSSAPQCGDRQGGQRLQRTFCMKTCGGDGDCRTGDGYACVEVTEVEPWQAEVVERGSFRTRVCALPYSGELLPEDRRADVCGDLPDASFPPPSRPPLREGGRADALDGAPDAPGDALGGDAADVSAATDAMPFGDASLDVGSGDVRGDSAPGDATIAADASRDAPGE